MAKCPHCGSTLRLNPNNAYMNIELCGGVSTVMTKCCDNFVNIAAKVTYKWQYSKARVEGYLQDDGSLLFMDDWNNEKIKPPTPEQEITHKGFKYVLKQDGEDLND